MKFKPAGQKLSMIKKNKYSNWGLLQTPQKNSDGEFLKNLKDTLNKVKSRKKHIVICGDFNYDLMKHKFNVHVNGFYVIFLFTTVYR